MNAQVIIELLAERHKRDVFVPECKDGGTWDRLHLRMDAWVLCASWRHPRTIVYEVKTARADFVANQKWMEYMRYGNEIYFVSPTDLISRDELPEACGLIWASKNGKMLRVVKKAPWREVVVPDTLYRYLLMSRARIMPPTEVHVKDKQSNYAFWKAWLAQKEENRKTGRAVSTALAIQMESLRHAKERAEKRLRECEALDRILTEMGLSAESWWMSESRVSEAAKRLSGEQLLDHAISLIDRAQHDIQTLIALKDKIAEIRNLTGADNARDRRTTEERSCSVPQDE